jgi:BirA family transcriptional regulator, biotin operon repressor / biotin---[acetyl-CoA-carboxylase] ligase
VTTDEMWRLPLRTDAVATALAGSRWRPEVLASSPSTNAVVADRARAGESPGLLVVTDHQTAGRGRLDRTWVTPAGVALTFSLLVAPDDVPVARWPWLPLLAGVAVAHAVRRVAGVDARLKWPNDVLVDDAKTTGILVERVEGPRHASAVIGIGVNVLQTREELPVDTATSLAVAAGRPVDRVALLAAITDELGRGYDDWCAATGDARVSGLLATYTGLCATVGSQVRVELPRDEVLLGEATGIDDDGRLLVAGPSGTVALGAGDVVHVRRSLPPA